MANFGWIFSRGSGHGFRAMQIIEPCISSRYIFEMMLICLKALSVVSGNPLDENPSDPAHLAKSPWDITTFS